MNDARLQADESDRSRPSAGDDLLPPVEPPSAGFIIQLFVVPALIVVVIVLVWLTFNWLVRTASRPEDVIHGLEQGASIARWQRASELADMLGNERFAEFKRSSEAAAHVARILDREIEAGGMTDDAVEFRKYLARALGEFEVQDGIDVLLKAAETNRDPREQKVRDGALQAIAVRAYNLRRLDPPQELAHPELEPALLRLAGDEDPLIRFQTAYALGQVGTPRAIDRLEAMADDPDSATRYNAAVALAHRGNAKAAETLAEMLDPQELASMRRNNNDQRDIVQTAITAALELAGRNPDADLSLIIDSLEQLADSDPETLNKARLPPRAKSDAQRALELLRARRSKSPIGE